MPATQLTPDAKSALRRTIRGLRERMIEQITAAARGEYRLDVAIERARLPEGRFERRKRLDAWIAEEVRSAQAEEGHGKKRASGERTLEERAFQHAVREAAHTLVNRLVVLRILEHHGLSQPAVLSGGWDAPGYANEFVHYAGALTHDDTRGYQSLLDGVFAELAIDLPGLFGPVGLTELFPIPAATLRDAVQAIDDPDLATAWGDETTLGWVYQYWNDPEREAIDAKIADGGKVAPHEIAQKTQLFTERYIVEWLLQNSLGHLWLAICKTNGWTADAERVLPVLEARRVAWRAKREAGDVTLDALMPVATGLEDAWKYYVPQPLAEDTVATAPASIRDLKLLEPACGSGHFLVCAFDLLAAMYAEEARHRGETWTPEEIAERIVANNLHGIDIDPRAVQIAAAGLWIKAKQLAPGAKLSRVNLVAPSFRLGGLKASDPALVVLKTELSALGVAPEATDRLVQGLKGVDHLGTLLRVENLLHDLVDEAVNADGPLFARAAGKKLNSLEGSLSRFLDRHAERADLGLRVDGEQLASGIRFLQIAKTNTYHLVVGNPPYQGLSKVENFDYIPANYDASKADLYSAHIERSFEFLLPGGLSSLITMRGWMFLGQFQELRARLLQNFSLRAIVDLDSGAFQEVSAAQVVLSVAGSIFQNVSPCDAAVALRPTPTEDRASNGMTQRKRAGLLAHAGRHDFDPRSFRVIDGEPIVYWWSYQFMQIYAEAPKLGDVAPVRQGSSTAFNVRFVRKSWEVAKTQVYAHLVTSSTAPTFDRRWAPYIMGSSGRCWLEELSDVVLWQDAGSQLMHFEGAAIRNSSWHFRRGVAYSTIGSNFSARQHRWRSIFSDKGASVFAEARAEEIVCMMNRSLARGALSSLNPSISFQVGDVSRLPLVSVDNSSEICARLNDAFSEHEAHREASFEWREPGSSSWTYTQEWAQEAVDRPAGTPLPTYAPQLTTPSPASQLSFEVGVALGRLGRRGEKVLDVGSACGALAKGILFVGPREDVADSLRKEASAPLHASWKQHGGAVTVGSGSVRDWLRKDFFTHHKEVYENRPIYFPLSSEKRSFVAWVSIHRWTDQTLPALLADHLHPTLRQLDGELADMNHARASSDKKTAIAAEKQFATTSRLRDELIRFIDAVTECAERGAPPTDPACPPRAADAPFHMDLDDGVMINSAALWPLLEPQWKDPKKWWKQLCLADGKKDYDWAHLTRRYFPERVEAKCVTDPSLGVAHGCFWKYHPAKAFAWELRLQEEIRPDFTIDEEGSDEARARFVAERSEDAETARVKEAQRRARKAAKGDTTEHAEGEEAAEAPPTVASATADGTAAPAKTAAGSKKRKSAGRTGQLDERH